MWHSAHDPFHSQDTQDRTRKRIKDGLKESINAHQDYADNVLPRLKRAYFKKCQEAEVSQLALTPEDCA